MTENNNGWPSRPGVPLHPERDGAHWIVGWSGTLFVAEWVADTDAKFGGYFEWAGGDDYPMGMVENGWTYAGPCLTPTEHAAALADARAQGRREALEEAAEVARCVPIPEDCCAAGAHGRISAALEAAMRIRALAQGGCDAG